WMREQPRHEAELVTMFLAAGRGLEAVHLAGLVHRDFKPDNVLVGRDGRPRVSDFGLVSARAAVVAHLTGETTRTAPAGTPAYMAPDQVAGLASDARSDQFSFCVTLYEALCGERPFATGAPQQQRCAPARPPRDWRGSPRLFAIVARGLANRPEDRWPSMTALLAALGQDRAARRRRILAATVVGIVAALLLVGGLAARRSAARRVHDAAALGQQVQQIRGRMHAAHLLPLHDTKLERDRVRAQMKAIQEQMRQLGDEGRGPGELALGVGYFALGERAEARKHLEAAWAAGERTPDLAYDLGLVLGDLYRRQRQNPPPFRTEEERQAHEREINHTLRDPAFAYLRQAEGAADTSPAYVAALVARWERRFDDALRNADAAFAEAPSLYEAAILGGEIQSERAATAFNAGDQVHGAALFADAEARFQRAIDIGRSDPSNYMLYGDWLMDFAYYRERLGQAGGPALEHAIALCRQGQQADSEAVWPDELAANVGWLLADNAFIHQRDPRPYVQIAIAAAERATARDPQSARGYANLGGAWLSRATDWDLVHGEDASVSFRKAMDAFAAARERRRFVDDEINFGLATAGLAAWRSAHGEDADELLESALAAFDRGHKLRPDLHFSDSCACDALIAHGRDRFERGQATQVLLERADRYCTSARTGDPGMPEPFDVSARLDGLRAQAAWHAGADPLPAWESALQHEETAIRLNPKRALSHTALAELTTGRAEYLVARGRDARRDLERAQAAAAEVVRLAPIWSDGYRARAFVELVRARAAFAHGDPTAAIAAGLDAAEHALRIKSDDGSSLLRAAELRWLEARTRARRGLPHAAALAEGRTLVGRRLALDPRAASALTIRAALERLARDAAQAVQ
ncbi:MAG: hypothetical protein JWN44_414, partial [Myxococcales bacterium]|nr:hypothetical protein [Myxococcales bacterium]